MELQQLVFDSLEPRLVPVTVAGKNYILREADEEVKVAYQNAGARAARFNADGVFSGIEGAGNVEPLLVSLCLFEADENGKLRLTQQGNADKRFLVSEATIRKWPARIVSKLFDTIRDISELEDKETEESLNKQIAKLQRKLAKLKEGKEESKNEQSDTTDSST